MIPLNVQLSNEDPVRNLKKADTDILFYDWEFASQASYIMEHCDFIHTFICLQAVKGYEHIVEVMLEERSARYLKKHLSEEIFPKHYKVKGEDLSGEAGRAFFNSENLNETVKAYVLDDHLAKKPYGAWCRQW